MNLREKIVQLIQEETKILNLPNSDYVIGTIPITKSYLEVNMDGTKITITAEITITRNGKYHINIDGQTKMINTIEEVRQVLDIENFYKKLSADRQEFIEKIRKTGLTEVDPKTVENIRKSNFQSFKANNFYEKVMPEASPVAAVFKISDTKIMEILKYDKHSLINDKIIHLCTVYPATIRETPCSVKNFHKTFKEFIGGDD
jgi:hypothetical protein